MCNANITEWLWIFVTISHLNKINSCHLQLSLIVITTKLTEKVFKGIFRDVSRKIPEGVCLKTSLKINLSTFCKLNLMEFNSKCYPVPIFFPLIFLFSVIDQGQRILFIC